MEKKSETQEQGLIKALSAALPDYRLVSIIGNQIKLNVQTITDEQLANINTIRDVYKVKFHLKRSGTGICVTVNGKFTEDKEVQND